MHSEQFSQHLQTVAQAVGKLAQRHNPVLVAVDGCCASGKTCFANALKQMLDATVICCDHFFLPPDMRTSSRLDEVGGNVHYERLKEVISLARQNQPFVYERFSCRDGLFYPQAFVPAPVVIVEGTYSLHATLAEFFHLKVLLTVSEQTQLSRLRVRETPTRYNDFVTKWIPLEQKYLQQVNASDCLVLGCDEVF